jgi:hypothetical protein
MNPEDPDSSIEQRPDTSAKPAQTNIEIPIKQPVAA